ncbi:MAG: VCBS repeat-containing protein, partial [Acidobacteria bacterium]|nr:VCBS repeat-containing protein [Acidobacteriota bacterium]
MTSRKHNRISRWTDSLIAKTLVAAALALTALSTTGIAQWCRYTPKSPPGKVYPLFDYQLANGGSLPQTFTYQMEEDTITMTIADGASAGVAPYQVRIVLTSAPSVTWRKEIQEWTGLWGRGSVVATQGGDHGPAFMTLTPATCDGGVDTIVFRKAKLYGVMFDMYHLEVGNFSRILRGKVVTFNWVGDTNIQNPYPMPCTSPCVPLGVTRRTTDIALTGPAGWTTLPVASSIGDGNFRVTNHPIGDFAIWASTPQAVKLTGDFNGDSRGDIALTGPAGWQSLPVAFSNGNGTFTETNAFVGDFAGWASHPQAVKLTGDFNGDRKTDIALTGVAGWNTLPVAFSNGDGTFNVTNLPVGVFASLASDTQAAKLTGDFNGDGWTDIALTGGTGWYMLPVAYSNGNGTFNVTTSPVG